MIFARVRHQSRELNDLYRIIAIRDHLLCKPYFYAATIVFVNRKGVVRETCLNMGKWTFYIGPAAELLTLVFKGGYPHPGASYGPVECTDGEITAVVCKIQEKE